MVIYFVDGSKIYHSIKAIFRCSKKKNILYVNDNDLEYEYALDVVDRVEFVD